MVYKPYKIEIEITNARHWTLKINGKDVCADEFSIHLSPENPELKYSIVTGPRIDIFNDNESMLVDEDVLGLPKRRAD